ncbi:hypothetical protein PPTG_13775 [Phytophthora nicotianae INRA-310]|uniref:Uncharacterized protein n=1 Tax=Phytophthora nicotianae (strain INRA-310) TaxID=761204 RepID=W2Q0P1_PHYN3|nr:hypothetical protein PPTG_13775 [Phytophthora nicotianae INRA-310]ETN06451.1 hypothetical protein PPTG_13775 [Phytophthora nicotianae INRA-310]
MLPSPERRPGGKVQPDPEDIRRTRTNRQLRLLQLSTLRVGDRRLYLLLLEEPTDLEGLMDPEDLADQGARILLRVSLPRRGRYFREVTVPPVEIFNIVARPTHRWWGYASYGMPSHIKSAVRMIQPFYSDVSLVEKKKTFWEAFERTTKGLSEPLRLSAFRETRFHNQFVFQTPLQMIERLKTTKRSKGMSAEVWGDQISSLCDGAQYFNPQMRYQYFLSGLRNSERKADLATTMANSISEAVAVLIYKNMQLPVEDESEFENALQKDGGFARAMVRQVMGMAQQTQNLFMQQL